MSGPPISSPNRSIGSSSSTKSLIFGARIGRSKISNVIPGESKSLKVRCNKLTKAQTEALHIAVSSVLAHARDTIEERQPALDEKVRDFLKVRNRKGEPCPRCGTSIRVAGVRGYDTFFCPTCQKDGGSGLVDWSRLRS